MSRTPLHPTREQIELPMVLDCLSECGLMQTRVAGTNRFMRLRREDLDARFPGLLDAVLNSAAKDADRLQLLPECETVEVD